MLLRMVAAEDGCWAWLSRKAAEDGCWKGLLFQRLLLQKKVLLQLCVTTGSSLSARQMFNSLVKGKILCPRRTLPFETSALGLCFLHRQYYAFFPFFGQPFFLRKMGILHQSVFHPKALDCKADPGLKNTRRLRRPEPLWTAKRNKTDYVDQRRPRL